MTEQFDYMTNEKAKLFEEFNGYFKEYTMPVNAQLDVLIDLVITKCAQKSLDAGFSGSWSDGGARADFDALKKFVAGYIWAYSREYGRDNIPHHEYNKMLADYQKQNDPDYQQYLKLKERFGE